MQENRQIKGNNSKNRFIILVKFFKYIENIKTSLRLKQKT